MKRDRDFAAFIYNILNTEEPANGDIPTYIHIDLKIAKKLCALHHLAAVVESDLKKQKKDRDFITEDPET